MQTKKSDTSEYGTYGLLEYNHWNTENLDKQLHRILQLVKPEHYCKLSSYSIDTQSADECGKKTPQYSPTVTDHSLTIQCESNQDMVMWHFEFDKYITPN